MQRPNSSSSSSLNPSLIRFPVPFTGNRVGAPPPPPIPPTFQPKHSFPAAAVEERTGAGFSPSLPPSPFTMYHSTSRVVAGGSGNLPPRKTSHRRSNSDHTFVFSSMSPSKSLERPVSGCGEVSDWSKLVKEEERRTLSEGYDDALRAYMRLDKIDAESSRGRTRKMTNGGSTSGDSEGESNVKRRAGGDIAPTSRHYRSVSVDSCCFREGAYSVGFGKYEFSAADMKKIAADEKLAGIVMADPKRVKRMLANRASAARSKDRETKYIAQLEHKVQTLQIETTTLSAHLTHLQRDNMGLQNQNSELKFRLQSMEQQTQLRNALSEKLTEEVQRLRLVIGVPNRSESNISNASLTPEMFQQQLRISQLQHPHYNE